MKKLAKEARIGISLFIVICVLVIVYILSVTLIAQVAMPGKANGSLLYVDGKVVGSALIGQSFTSPRYFHGRPSAVDYDGNESGASNLGPNSEKLMEQVRQRVQQVRQENGLPPDASVPADLVLASGSGLDPDISIDSAMLQVPRVAIERGLPETKVKSLVEQHIVPLQLGFLGQERVNVLKLNLALDALTKSSK